MVIGSPPFSFLPPPFLLMTHGVYRVYGTRGCKSRVGRSFHSRAGGHLDKDTYFFHTSAGSHCYVDSFWLQ